MCCLGARDPRVVGHAYSVVRGCGVYASEVSLDRAKRVLAAAGTGHLPPDLELQRVVRMRGGGRRYELVRGGRWVDDWQGQHGRHRGESNTWTRR